MGLSCASHEELFDKMALASPRHEDICVECKNGGRRCPYDCASSSDTEEQIVCPTGFSILPLKPRLVDDNVPSGPTSTGGSTNFVSETEGESSLWDDVAASVSADDNTVVGNPLRELASDFLSFVLFNSSKSSVMKKSP